MECQGQWKINSYNLISNSYSDTFRCLEKSEWKVIISLIADRISLDAHAPIGPQRSPAELVDIGTVLVRSLSLD